MGRGAKGLEADNVLYGATGPRSASKSAMQICPHHGPRPLEETHCEGKIADPHEGISLKCGAKLEMRIQEEGETYLFGN